MQHPPPPPPPGSRATAEASYCVCAKRWIWGRGSLSLFTEQGRLSSDAKATKSCKRKLSRSTRTLERGAGRKVRSGSQNPGVEPPRPVSALGPPAAAAAASPRPQPLSLKRVEVWRRGGDEGWGVRGCIHTKKIPQLGVHAACIKNTKTRLRKARSKGRTRSVQSFKNLTRESIAILCRLGRVWHLRKLCWAGRLSEPLFPVEGRADHLGKPGERAGGGEIWPEGGGECPLLLSCRFFLALGDQED